MSSTAELYQVGASEKIKTLEAELAKELQDLKNDIEENEMLSGVPRAASSVGIPKGVEHFRKLREQIIRRAMQVSEAQPLVIQADVMKEEMDNCLIREYTNDSLPLLLHQFFCDRIQQLVQCKHMHMLRWRRFCEHSKTLESLYPVYQKRLLAIMDEYSDAVARAQRLSVVHESLLIGRPPAHNAIEKDDLIIYLKWLVSHLHSVKKIHSFIKHLEWFSVSNMHQLRPPVISQKKAVTVPWQEESRRAPSPTEKHGPSNVIESKGRWSIFAGRPSIAETTLSSGRVSMENSPRPAMVVEEAESDYLASSGSVLPLSSSLRRAGAGTVPNNPHAAAACAASGGGPSSDPENSGMPCHLLDFQSLRPLLEFLLPLYGLTVDLDGISSTSDEMELAVHVSRKFKSAFSKQEEQKTFPTYDKLESGNESWGADTSSHALLKESNWLPYVKLKPEKDAAQEKIMTKLRQSKNVDELLRAQSKFFAVKDSLKVMDALKEHAIAVRDPPSVQAVSVTSHKTAFNSNVIWRKIYSNPSLFQDSDDDMDVADFDDKDADNVNFSGPSSHSGGPLSRGRRKADESGFDFANAMQMLGLEDEDSPQQDPTMVQGGLLSFLQLRHLRIRDLQRTCLSVLNYFRSLERTLTINDGGLSLEGKNQKKGSTNHVYGSYESGLGGGGSLGYHGYLHNTPADFKQSESDFMEFSDVENHDDFYSVDEGRVHVQDLRGYYVIYDAASEDFNRLSQDLLLVATHYIEKDLHMRKMNLRTSHQAFKKRQAQPAGEVDLPSYGHLPVDRFAVLLDLWTNEAAFLENKRQLIDVYVEAYHHVFDMHERRLLAQVITNLMNKHPRYDFTADYFVSTYKEECRCLRLHCKLIKSILDQQIDDDREFIHKMGYTKEEHGLPYPVIAKQPVALNLSRPALKYVYLLEFHPSLSLASRIPMAIKFALDELKAVHQPSSTTATIHMEIKLLELAVKKWLQMEPPGSSYSTQMQKDLFSDLFVENPHFVCEIGDSLEAAREAAAGRRTPKEKLEDTLRVWSKLMEIVTTRHRLLEAAVETEILAKIYRKQATEMGFDEYHLFLMCVQFDFASFKENADHPPPLFITALQEDDPNVDRYVFANLNLAIQELDEKMVAAFNFKSRDGVMKLMKGKGLETLQVILMAQVLQKNALVSAVQQVHVCSASRDPDKTDSGTLKNNQKTSENRSERSSLLAVAPGGDASSAAAAFVNQLKGGTEVQQFTPESFVSLQLEKRPSRDVMLNHFLNKKTTMGTILKNPEEVEKLKKTLIVEFCQRFHTRICQYSLRGQIIAYLNSILVLLEDFPAVQKSHFVIGLPNEKKTKQDSQAGLATNPRELKKRPRRLLSQDGSMLLNLWFLPHHSEVLIMYKTLENEACMKALQCTLRIVSALHDILQYLCAHSKLGSSPGRVYLQQKEYVTADWGGTEGILAELRETQKQVNHLENPSDPEQVADLLTLRRDVLFLEFDAAIRHSLRNTLLSTKNAPGFLKVTENMNIGLPALSNVQRPSMYGAYLRIPEPLQPRDFKAQEVFPWRSFLGRRGPFPSRFWQWTRIESYMQLCLCELKEVDRHAANGEILGVALLMEDVLQSGQQEIVMSPDNSDTEDQSGESERPPSSVRPKSTASIKSKTSQLSVADEILEEEKKEDEKPVAIKKKALSRTTEPVKAYILLKDFLLLWKRLEVFKEEWGQRKLMVQIIDSPSLYQKFCQIFKVDILYPVVKNIASKYGQGDLYEGMTLDDEPIVAPKGASEMELRAKQLVKLLDELEHHMIHEVQRKTAREHALVIAERAREEGNLPTDLWKRPAINERPVIPKPHIAEDFSRVLLGCCREEGEKMILTREDLNKSLASLASVIMLRERSSYENYSMFYENLLRQHHQLLYQKEQEIKYLQRACAEASSVSLVDVQCQLADRSHELILEITALRSKIHEMREMTLTQQQEIREQIRDEYDQLIQNLFGSTFSLKNKFDQFGKGLYDECYGIVSEVREESAEAMSRYKARSAGSGSNEVMDINMKRARTLQQMRQENTEMSQLVLKMKALTNWKLSKVKESYNKKVSQLKSEIDKCRKDYLYIKMTAEEEVILLRQQVVALRKALAESEHERESTSKLLEKEFRIKTERKHREDQEAYNARQMELARAANVQKMIEDIDDKEARLNLLSEDLHRTTHLHQTAQEKNRRDFTQVKQKLVHERNLKLDAFQRVDELQAQVYDYEAAVSSMSRPFTSMSLFSPGRLPPMRSRASTSLEKSVKSRASSYRDTPVSSTPWPPGASFPPNYQQRSLTPDPRMIYQTGDDKLDRMTQRPKTVGSRLRNKIAEQLLTNLEPDNHEMIMQLQAMQQSNTKYK